MFWVTWSDYHGVPMIGLHGELDAGTRESAWGILQPTTASRLILDLGKLEFCDCAGLRALVRIRQHCEQLGGWLILCSPQGIVQRLLTLTNAEFIIWEDFPPPGT
jgi:anti-anti-sigma factor